MPNCNAILDTHAGCCEGRKGELRLRLTASPYHRTQCLVCLRLRRAVEPPCFFHRGFVINFKVFLYE